MPVGASLAAASVAGAVISGNASQSAAKTQANAANAASQQQLDMFNTIRNDLSPYRSIGTDAVSPYEKLLGIGAGSSNGGTAATTANPGVDWNDYLTRYPDVAAAWQNLSPAEKQQFPTPQSYAAFHYQTFGQLPDEKRTVNQLPTTGPNAPQLDYNGQPISDVEAQLQSLPGYQFQKDQGIQAVNRTLGARGQTGAQAKGIARFVTGLADSTYGEQVGRIANAVGVGQSAANQTGAYGQAAANSSGQALIGGANASAAGTVGAANAVTGGINSASNAYLTNKLLGGGGLYGGSGVNGGTGYGYAYNPLGGSSGEMYSGATNVPY